MIKMMFPLGHPNGTPGSQALPFKLRCGSHRVGTAEMQQPNHRPGLDPPGQVSLEGRYRGQTSEFWKVWNVAATLEGKDITTLCASAS